jgi:hypothetical protein
LRNQAKRSTQKNHHSADLALLDPLLQERQDFTLTGAISGAFLRGSYRCQNIWTTPPLREPGPGSTSPLIARMTGAPRQPLLRSRPACNTYHLCAVNSLTSVSRVKGPIWMGIETEGDKRSTSPLEQKKRGFTKCRAKRRLRREMPADIKPSYRTTRGEGGE